MHFKCQNEQFDDMLGDLINKLLLFMDFFDYF